MKKINVSVLMMLMVFTTTLYSQSRDKVVKSFNVSKGGTLEVDINPGDITIKTWDKGEVMVKVSDIERDDADDLKISQNGDNVSVRFNSGWGWADDIDVDITIPEYYNVDLSTTGGSIKLLTDLHGEFKANSAGGDIRSRNIYGDIKAHTSGGDVTIGDAEGEVNLNTSGGDIRVGNVNKGDVSITTMGGDIRIDNVEKRLEAKTYGGDIDIGDVLSEVEATTFGGDIKLSSGKNLVDLSTYGGDISIREANGKVSVDTKGGSISLRAITGSVNARTAAGSIYVELTPSESGRSEFRTSNGNVELVLNANSKVTIDAKIKKYWKNGNGYSIRSDFEGKVEESKKEITGSYVVNGGGHKITIATTNAGIKIEKSRK
ncbi:MAG: DUF4097 family beta strand repeat-containing protein [Melioribacteraceae bacterium]|nr:DUF4097 family beta strand repeat-containing protein [Melioribacteraceae bacterium]MCF8262921.1 DUF4097 family beta strand repeat-containing protein [Melioribacteraceae bacterium]MCF8431086.1 DUF4097 family beta strand repeat-containing protein [Melioribacteraceae bacterium]